MNPEPIDTRARSVTFFEDRARVCRVATVEVEEGLNVFVLRGFSAVVDDDSLAARITDDSPNEAVIKACQVERVFDTEMDGRSEDHGELREKVQALRGELAEKNALRRRIKLALNRTAELERELLNRLAENPGGKALDAKSWRKALTSVREKISEKTEVLRQVNTEAAELTDRVDRAEKLWRRSLQEEPKMKALVEVQLEAAQAGEVALEFEYFVPCALWRPSHVARVDRDTQRLTVITEATVWQATGEEWEDVDAYFSTARLTKPSSPPLLDEDILQAREKTKEERRTIQAEVREQAIDDLADARRSVDEMPGIDDGGRPLVFSARAKATIPADGSALRLEFGRAELEVELTQDVYGELTASPHLVATGTWTGPAPLLAGPLTLIRDREYAGRSRQDFVAVGDQLQIGFGQNHTVRVQRRVDESRDRTRITGKQRLDREVTLYLSNLGAKPERFEIVERVPVSELAEVDVSVEAGAAEPDRDGFLRIPVTLKPGETRKENFRYRVTMDSKVKLAL